MKIRVKDLPDVSSNRHLPMLYCPLCQGQYSADPGDYWSVNPDLILECCETPMRLVWRETVYRPLKRCKLAV